MVGSLFFVKSRLRFGGGCKGPHGQWVPAIVFPPKSRHNGRHNVIIMYPGLPAKSRSELLVSDLSDMLLWIKLLRVLDIIIPLFFI